MFSLRKASVSHTSLHKSRPLAASNIHHHYYGLKNSNNLSLLRNPMESLYNFNPRFSSSVKPEVDVNTLNLSEPRTSPQEAGLVPTLEDSNTEDAIRDILRNVSKNTERTWFTKTGKFSRPDVVSFRPIDELMGNHEFSKHVITENILDKMVYFHIPRGNVEWAVVRLAFIRAGIKRVRGENWNVIWGRHLDHNKYMNLNAFQRVNHFPGSSHLGRKDRLAILMEHMAEYWSEEEFSFHPTTYILPEDSKKLQHYIKKQLASGRDPLLIKKPPAASCGRRIKVFRGSSSLPLNEDCIVQEYIANPLLVNDFKFDLRLYVVVTSYNPLRIYLYNDGLTRFATQPYSTTSVHSRMMHLTNYSINKKSPLFVKNTDEEADDVGSKWSVAALKRHFREEGVADAEMWSQVNDIIIKTLIAGERVISDRMDRFVPHRNSCFELYGFDIMIDDEMKPWLVEVNLLPSLACESPMDKRIKSGAITDLLDLVGVVQYDRRNYLEEKEKLEFHKNYNKALLEGETLEIANALEEALYRPLTNDDFLILEETEFEETRRGNYELIFPLAENADEYRTFFGNVSKQNQRLLCEWRKLETKYTREQLRSFLEKATQNS